METAHISTQRFLHPCFQLYSYSQKSDNDEILSPSLSPPSFSPSYLYVAVKLLTRLFSNNCKNLAPDINLNRGTDKYIVLIKYSHEISKVKIKSSEYKSNYRWLDISFASAPRILPAKGSIVSSKSIAQ